jgi:hypothetical protein
MRSDSDPCAVLPAKTADRQRTSPRSTELRHPRGHLTLREAVKIACKQQYSHVGSVNRSGFGPGSICL